MADYLDRVSDFLSQTSFVDLADGVVEHTGYVIADTLACVAAGAREPEMAALRTRLTPKSTGPALVIGSDRCASSETAAFLNASAGTFHELDEGNRFARGHPGIHVIPTALSFAGDQPVGGREFLTAIVLGYDVAARLGSAMRIRPGGHPHGTWGTVGAAVAVGKLADYSPAKFRDAINIAATLSILPSGVAVIEGATAALTYPGAGCRQALLVHDIVCAGLKGQRDAPTTVYGDLLSDSFDPAQLTDALGERWEIIRNYFKRFACVRYAHGLLDALEKILDARPGHCLNPRSIASIEARAHMPVGRLTEAAPANPLAARASIPFALATHIVTGSAGIAGFTPQAIANTETGKLAARITVVEDPALTAQMPAKRPAQITIKFNDGTELTAANDHIRGDPEAPLSTEELRAKFDSLIAGTWSPSTAESIWQTCRNLSELSELSTLTELLAQA